MIKEGGQLVCGLHRTPVAAHEGYLYKGLITFTNEESMNFGTDRFPNTLGATFTVSGREIGRLSAPVHGLHMHGMPEGLPRV